MEPTGTLTIPLVYGLGLDQDIILGNTGAQGSGPSGDQGTKQADNQRIAVERADSPGEPLYMNSDGVRQISRCSISALRRRPSRRQLERRHGARRDPLPAGPGPRRHRLLEPRFGLVGAGCRECRLSRRPGQRRRTGRVGHAVAPSDRGGRFAA